MPTRGSRGTLSNLTAMVAAWGEAWLCGYNMGEERGGWWWLRCTTWGRSGDGGIETDGSRRGPMHVEMRPNAGSNVGVFQIIVRFSSF